MRNLNERVMDLVVQGLTKLGYKAEHMYPGFVQITQPDGTTFNTGTANDTWDVQHMSADGSTSHPGGFDTGVPVLPEDSAITDFYLKDHAALIVQQLAKGLEVAFPVLTLRYLLDVVSRSVAILETQHDANNEPLAWGSAALYDELRAIQRLATAIETSPMGSAADEFIPPNERHFVPSVGSRTWWGTVAKEGQRLKTTVEDEDTDDDGNERLIPIGTLGILGALNSAADESYSIAWDNGAWTIWTVDELARDAEVVR